MQGQPDVIQALNGILKDALTAINQHFLHARMYRNQGLGALNERIYRHSIIDMKAADALVERLLFLEGLPNLQDLGKLTIGENVPEMLASDLAMARAHRERLREAIATCEQAGDYVSRDLLDDLLEKREDIIDWLETQQHLLRELGLPNYLQSRL